jgi:uncharacterized damage-inducible protein DinB
MSQSPYAALIEQYVKGPAELERLVTDLSREQLLARPIAGKWSTLEVVCHLADSEQAWCHRMKRVIAEDRPLLIGYDESRFTASLAYQVREVETELLLVTEMRQQMAAILRKLPEAAWVRAGVHNERGLITLAEMLKVEVEHIQHHIGTIIEKRRALGL